MALNLAQRRLVASFQTKYFEGWKKEFMSILGFEVPVEVTWDDFFHGSENTADEYLEQCWKNIFFIPLGRAVQAICSDEMGKTAIKEKLKKVVIAPDTSKYSPRSSFEFTNGDLKIMHDPRTNDGAVDERATEWQKMMETAL